MSLWKIAWRSIQQRGLASALTGLSMALGVLLVVAVLSIHGVVSQSFKNNSSLGYNLIVGAKGGKMQLTLNTVYYLSQPVENIPYEYFLEFVSAEQRSAALEHSIRREVHDAQWNAIEATSSTVLGDSGLGGVAGLLAGETLREADRGELELDRGGKFGELTAFAIPLCLGDYFGRFRVVGTTPDLFDKLAFGAAADRKYEFAEGRNFEHWNEEHEYFEAVVGATVAREKNVEIGQEISPSHSDPEGDSHAQHFTVVGILEPTGTPNDRVAFINMEGFYLMEDHSKPLSEEEEAQAEEDEEQAEGFAGIPGGFVEPEEEPDEHADHDHNHDAGPKQPLPVEQREVTAILVRTANPFVAVGLPNRINEGNEAQCVMPIQEIRSLFRFIVDPIRGALLAITALVCLVSGISILVSIYNSMSDRKHEIAVMRALGASRGAVMTVILFESILLSVVGGFVGWFAAHGLNALASPIVEQRTGVSIGFRDIGEVHWFKLTTGDSKPAPTREDFLAWQKSQLGFFWLFVHAIVITGAGIVGWQGAKRRGVLYGIVAFLLGVLYYVMQAAFWEWMSMLFLGLGFYVLSLLEWRASIVARWGMLTHLTGVLISVLVALFHFGVPFNIEMLVLPSLVLLAVSVGILPAMAAYKTDVAKSLGS
jgi:putative ABC transport system permease protein